MVLYVQMSKNITKFIYLYIYTFLVLILQSACFIYTTWKRKQTMKQQPHRACERMKSKQKQNQVTSHSNWPHVLLFDLAYKQCSGIFEVWLCCLSSESKRRFLVNDILIIYVCLSMMFGHGVNPVFFDKRIKDWTSRTLVNPTHPLHPVTSHFCLSPSPSSKWTSYVYHP